MFVCLFFLGETSGYIASKINKNPATVKYLPERDEKLSVSFQAKYWGWESVAVVNNSKYALRVFVLDFISFWFLVTVACFILESVSGLSLSNLVSILKTLIKSLYVILRLVEREHV